MPFISKHYISGTLLSAFLFLTFFISCAHPPAKQDKLLTRDFNPKSKKASKKKSLTRAASERDKSGDIYSLSDKEVTGWLDNPSAVYILDEDEKPAASSGGTVHTYHAPKKSGLMAGSSDDNQQFNYFTSFLEQYQYVPHFPLEVSERIIIQVEDLNHKSIANANIEVFFKNKLLCRGETYADGKFYFFPSMYNASFDTYTLKIRYGNIEDNLVIRRKAKRDVIHTLQTPRVIPGQIPLDILFIFDTTGSMGEEIERLKKTIALIHLNLQALSIKPLVRFGMVLYRDRTDKYNTRIVSLTSDLDKFQAQLDEVSAGGGGDKPEDLQEALRLSMQNIKWNTEGLRLSFIITDAAPHLDYKDQDYTYVNAVQDARKQSIKIFSIGTGGLDITGEYVLRQISQFTGAQYIFLTYGEEGESEGGSSGSVSHHTGANYQNDKLESIILNIAREELSHFSDKPIISDGGYFQAAKVVGEEPKETLDILFERALAQLNNFSSLKLAKVSATAILPVESPDKTLAANAEYITDILYQATSRSQVFKLVERKDLQNIASELKLQLSGITDEKNTVKVGQLMNAELIISGKLYEKEKNIELFLKLLSVETGEVLSVTKSVIDRKLLL
ncbi:MAG: VWA domain-containing protein [Fibrobacteria bacterium]|nr:VWA domain-containing protein [Fibrobacteria bacterium]